MEERFICLEYGHIFDEPKTYSESTPGGIYKYDACPYCESGYRKAKQCEICMGWKLEETGEYIDGNFTCKDCLEKLEIIDE